MSKLILFEDRACADLQPLTSWRSVFELRLARRTFFEEIVHALQRDVDALWVRSDLVDVVRERFRLPVNEPPVAGDVLVNGRWMPEGPLEFPDGPCVGRVGDTIAFVVCDQTLSKTLTGSALSASPADHPALTGVREVPAGGSIVRYLWDLIAGLGSRLAGEWSDADAGIGTDLDSRITLLQPAHIHVGERVRIHPTASLDATHGPVFIESDVEIGAQAVIEGPIYFGSGTRINARAWLHGGNAIGPMCKLGGEIDACIITGFSNKQHDGFLGHAYVGQWVNIGAGTNNSDLKNTYGSIRVPLNGKDIDTGLQFFGALIGDHVKLGINSTIPTGAVIGFGAVGATTKVLPKNLAPFSWVTDDQSTRGDIDKLIQVAETVMQRRQQSMSDAEKALFRQRFVAPASS